MNKVDPRIKRTRQLLQTAFSDLLKEKTFHQVTVQDIAERAEVNRATFYAHFEDKYDLLNYTVQQTLQAMLEARLGAHPNLSVDNLRRLTLTLCEYMREFIGHCAPSTRNSDHIIMMSQAHTLTYNTLLMWVKAAPQQTALSPDVVAQVCSWAIFGSVFQWVQEGRKIPPNELTEQILQTLLVGLEAYLDE